MKRIALGILTATVLGALAMPVLAANPRGTTTVKVNGATVSIEYGRPALQGKTIGQELDRLPVGQFWRLGADKSTTFTTSAELHFGNVVVPKGVYSLFARKDANDKWTLVFNKQHGQWGIKGNGAANLDPKLDVAAVPLQAGKAANSEDLVTITLGHHAAGGSLKVQWGDLELMTAFTAA